MEAGKRQDQRLLPAPAEFSGRPRVIRARHLSKYGPRKGRGWDSMPPGGGGGGGGGGSVFQVISL